MGAAGGGTVDRAGSGARTNSSSSSGTDASRRRGGGGIGIGIGTGAGAGGAARRLRTIRTMSCTSQNSPTRTRSPICSIAYGRPPDGAGGSPVPAIDSRIDVSAWTFFMR